MKMTIRDIASEAGVSIGTVSRVLNRAGNVDPELYQKTMLVIERNNYCPGRRKPARATATADSGKKHGSIAIMFDSASEWKGSRLVADYMGGIEKTCFSRGYNVVLHMKKSFDDPALLGGLKNSVDGILIKGEFICDSPLPGLVDRLRRDIPTVGFGMSYPLCKFPQVSFDNYMAGMLAAEELIKLGHRRIAFVNNNPRHTMFITRSQGFMMAMKRHGLWANELLLEHDGAANGELPEEAPPDMSMPLEKILSSGQKITAAVCANDWISTGLYRACSTAGVDIPGDLSIVGFDNMPSICQLVTPKLSSVENPFFQIGELAVNILLDRIERRTIYQDDMASIQYLPGTFIRRDSIKNLL